jgi:hypothetical protein
MVTQLMDAESAISAPQREPRPLAASPLIAPDELAEAWRKTLT